MTESLTITPPNYALIYAKIARHVAAADALLGLNHVYEASEELSEAMEAIKAFETVSCMITKEALPND
jgi:hypothetical protein